MFLHRFCLTKNAQCWSCCWCTCNGGPLCAKVYLLLKAWCPSSCCWSTEQMICQTFAALVLHHKQPPLQSAVVCKSDAVSCLTSHMTLQHLGCCCSRKTFYWKFDVCVVEVKRKAQTPQDTRASSALDVLNLHGWSWRLSGCLKSSFSAV